MFRLPSIEESVLICEDLGWTLVPENSHAPLFAAFGLITGSVLAGTVGNTGFTMFNAIESRGAFLPEATALGYRIHDSEARLVASLPAGVKLAVLTRWTEVSLGRPWLAAAKQSLHVHASRALERGGLVSAQFRWANWFMIRYESGYYDQYLLEPRNVQSS